MKQNSGRHIHRIIATEPCPKHNADKGTGCWEIWSTHGLVRAICFTRAIAGGATGQVTPYEETQVYLKKEYKS